MNRTTSSVSSLLYHHVTTPKGRAMASPFLIARTFSSDSGRTIPATPVLYHYSVKKVM